MLIQEIIRIKRDGGVLDAAQIAFFVESLTSDKASEGQVAALAMAIFFNGMSAEETVALTLAMRDSGTVMEWDDALRPIVDKHSTGGVGDNVSLMLAPIVAACGGFVPMISGRGLGHTGGTLDKMDSIPGYVSQPSEKKFRKVVRKTGCAIIGQTAKLAPADGRFYAIRDTTATVESIPLVTASILSKKLSAGLQSLVLDVKTGSGAFMTTRKASLELARSLVTVATGAGLSTTALVTDMDQPLADAAGNALEVAVAVDFLTGARREDRLEQVTLALAQEMLLAAGLAATLDEAESRARTALESGRAAEIFEKMVSGLGGPSNFLADKTQHLPKAPVVIPVAADRTGAIAKIDTRAVGMAVVELGGGRRNPEDGIDHAVGLSAIAPLGRSLSAGEPLAIIHARDKATAESAAASLRAAFEIGDAPKKKSPIIERVTATR